MVLGAASPWCHSRSVPWEIQLQGFNRQNALCGTCTSSCKSVYTEPPFLALRRFTPLDIGSKSWSHFRIASGSTELWDSRKQSPLQPTDQTLLGTARFAGASLHPNHASLSHTLEFDYSLTSETNSAMLSTGTARKNGPRVSSYVFTPIAMASAAVEAAADVGDKVRHRPHCSFGR